MARESRADGALAKDDAYAAGVLMAWIVMFARVLGMVALLNPGLLKPLLWPFGAMLAVNVGFAAWHYLSSLTVAGHQADTMGEVPLKNPFSLWAATKFGLLFAVVLLMVEIARRSFSTTGLMYVAVLAGTTDVDAITLSMVDFARDTSQLGIAAQAVVAGVLSNTVVKAGLTVVLGSRGLARRMIIATAAMMVAGLLGIWLA